MSLTIVSARWANEQNDAAIIQTVERGAVLAVPERGPEWAALQLFQEQNGVVEAYQPYVPNYREKRAAAYIAELSKEPDPAKASFMTTTGDTLDVLIAQVEAMRAELGAARTADFAAMLGKIQAVKTEFPKPA